MVAVVLEQVIEWKGSISETLKKIPSVLIGKLAQIW